MGLFKKIVGILGFFRDEHHDNNDEDGDAENDPPDHENTRHRRPTKGFSVQVPVPVPVPVDRAPPHLGPVLAPANLGLGGVQGLNWHAKRLRIDEDGDVAEEFLDEVLPRVSGTDNQRPLPKFELKYRARPVKVTSQVISDGNISQSVEYRGRLQWV